MASTNHMDIDSGSASSVAPSSTSPCASQYRMTGVANHIDPLDLWDIENDAEWLEKAIALDLEQPSVAAASSEGAAAAG